MAKALDIFGSKLEILKDDLNDSDS